MHHDSGSGRIDLSLGAAELDRAFDRLADFLAVQGDALTVEAVVLLQESLGIDDDARVTFGERLEQVQPNAPRGAALLGLILGLSAARLAGERGR